MKILTWRKAQAIGLIFCILFLMGCSNAKEVVNATVEDNTEVVGEISQEEVSTAIDYWAERKTLYDAYRMDPNEATAERVMNYVLPLEEQKETDTEAISKLHTLADLIVSMEEGNIKTAVEALQEESWKTIFFLEEGILTAGYQTKIDGVNYTLATDAMQTCLTLEKETKEKWIFVSNEKGTLVYQELADGKFLAKRLDEENTLFQTLEGQFAGDICVGELQIIVGDMTFVGQLDENGHSKEKQEKKDIVVYAKEKDGENILAAEDTTVEEFVVNRDFLKLP